MWSGHLICEHCNAEYSKKLNELAERDARFEKAEELVNELVKGVVKTVAVNPGVIDPLSADEIASQISDLLGGSRGLAHLFSSQLLEASIRNPGSRTALQGFKWLFDLIASNDDRQIRQRKLQQISDAELERMVKAYLTKQEEGGKAIDTQSVAALPNEEAK